MRVYEITPNLSMMLSNEEMSFVNKHHDQILVDSLNDKDAWMARNLVRKGVYELDKTAEYLVKRSQLTSE
jgi:hypothetical protein